MWSPKGGTSKTAHSGDTHMGYSECKRQNHRWVLHHLGRKSKVLCSSSIFCWLCVHNLTCNQAVLPTGGTEGTWERPVLVHEVKTTCPPLSGPTRISPHTTESRREFCQTLRVKAASLGQLQALQVLLENLPPFLPKTEEEDTSVGQHTHHADSSHLGGTLWNFFIISHNHSL